ncbi:MFS transporter [Hyphococcus sp. DH-69]|uniref:MFS transporter n=1 Tax=Hyphococcus formosus TaxID=3143534 RepID=UPI00398AF08C
MVNVGVVDQGTTKTEKSNFKVAITAAAGATIEWYDFFIYATAAALVFPTLFFPSNLSPFIAQIAAFSTFAVGFIARPIGGVLFGHFGDIVGRKTALVAALVIMGVATTLIGLLPTYEYAGPIAPCLLILLRVIQGFAVGGQWGGAVLLATENAPGDKRGFYGSFVQIGVPVGVVFANLLYLVLIATLAPEHFQAWGWRVPFLLSIGLVGIGLYIQFRLEETEEFKKVESSVEQSSAPSKKRSPVLQAALNHPKEILLAGGAFLANNCCFYVAITYVITYGVSALQLPKDVMLSAVMIASLTMVPVLIASGWLSDRWGRRELFMTGAILTGIWSFALFPLIGTGSFVLITLAIAIELAFVSMMYGPQAALFAELFPAHLRYSGASMGYQLGAVVGGGFAPIIATSLYEQFQSGLSIAIYLFCACAISFVCILLLSNRKTF